MKKIYILLYSCIFIFSAKAQQFKAIPVDKSSEKPFDTHFKNYSLFRINTSEIKSFARTHKTGGIDFTLDLPGLENLSILLAENDLLAVDYTLTVSSGIGKQVFGKPECITYEGLVKNQAASRIRLTITDDILYGIIRTNNKEYFIEPLNYISEGQPADVFVVYETKDAIADPSLTCGVKEARSEQQKLQDPSGQNAGLNCVRTELAIASDESMFIRYGSAAAVQTHNIGVINNVIWDYVNAQFNNNIEIIIVGQNVSTTAATDQTTPLYAGTNSGIILPNFRTWGNAGNFGFTYDLAQFWTTRNIDDNGAGNNSGIIGLAYVGVVCDASRYQLIEDFAGTVPTGSGFSLRVVVSHETGHNFGASHDAAGSPFIMAPSVQNTSTWSAASITSVDNHVGTRSCLAQCSASGPTTTNFIASPNAICTGGTVQFTDRTLGGPTSWSWTFSGGTPATSTARNPSVTFATAGTKAVTLTTNNGNGATAKSTSIIVATAPATACTNPGTGTTNSGIISFSLNNINRTTSGTATDGNKYLDFSCSDNTALAPSTTYSASAQVGTTTPANEFNLVQFFIDYNNDGDFLDANEAVYSSPSCYIGTHTFSFATPALGAVTTNTLLRARVIAKDCIGGVNSCYNVTLGQVEDYSVIFFNLVPVKLLSFTGYHKAGQNILNWKTTSEINADHFEIERSTDASTFSYIGRKDASGNAGGSAYDFTDDLLNAGSFTKWYYRLKIVDVDGHFTYSNIVVLSGDTKDISIYPNPVKKGETFKVNTGDARVSSVELIDATGRVIYRQAGSNIPGTVGVTVSESWSAGNYVIRVKTTESVYSQKLVIY